MDAQDRHELLCHVEALLLAIGPILRRSSHVSYVRAAAVFASIIRDKLIAPSLDANAVYERALVLRYGSVADDEPVALPANARGKFPFDAPTPHLRDMQDRIEAMLAPVGPSRPKALHLARLLKGFGNGPQQTGNRDTRSKDVAQ